MDPTHTPLPVTADERTLGLFTHDSTETEAQYESDLEKFSVSNLRSFIERHRDLDDAKHHKLLHIYKTLLAFKDDPDKAQQYVSIASKLRPLIDNIVTHDRSHKAAKAAPKHAFASKVAKHDLEFEHSFETISKDLDQLPEAFTYRLTEVSRH